MMEILQLEQNTGFVFQLLDQKESLNLQVQQLTLDCKRLQQKSTLIQSQIKDLQAERDQVRERWKRRDFNFLSSVAMTQ